MNALNSRPLLRTAANENIKKLRAKDSNATYLIRKRLISLANQIKDEAHQLTSSNVICKQFLDEINELRAIASHGDDL